MELKTYQKKVINDLKRFLHLLLEKQNIRYAYTTLWEEKGICVGKDGMSPYNSEIPGVPEVCFKVPTGGGKTFLAVNSIKPIFDSMAHIHSKAAVWLVPTDPILTQTYATLTNKNHDYRKKLDVDFSNKVEVYSKQQLLSGHNFNPVSVNENLSIFILSYDSFRTSNKDGRKAYQENGNLTAFANLKQDVSVLLNDADETALIQVIRMLNPVVVVDESHHATSYLSKEMLQNFNPSFVLNLTATPKVGSNIISYVDAHQLKSENMVKLPVIVYNRKNQEDVFLAAISLRNKLEKEAIKECRNSDRYIRPMVLFQAQPRNGEESTTYAKIKRTLIEIGIPEGQIVIKTGDKDELKNIDLMSSECEIRYVITVNALKEGWDCPFAYILATVANRSSLIDVEQILGRILRLPNAKRNISDVLNLSYVITSSTAFYATLDKVVVGLNKAGFSSKDYKINDSEKTTSYKDEPVYEQLKFEELTINMPEQEAVDTLDVSFMKEQVVNIFEIEENDKGLQKNPANEMIKEAQEQSTMYWQDINDNQEDYIAAPAEVIEKMKYYEMNQAYKADAIELELPQFMVETGMSLFSEHEYNALTKENLYAGFSLVDKDAEIDFNSMEAEIAKIDIDEKDSLPKAWKMQGVDSQYMKEWFDEQPTERKLRLCKDMIISKLSKNDAVNDRELETYVDRVMSTMTTEQLSDLEHSPYIYVQKINKKVNSLLDVYARKIFHDWIEQEKIVCKPSYKLPRKISPIDTIASIPKSLYSQEEKFDNEYERKVVMELSSLENVKWWHRNISRKGFAINGPVNAYPDLLVRLESGRLLLIETKGDQLENTESKMKAEIGARWALMAGRMYRYFMVFETKNPEYNGAYSYEEFMKIVREL